jgi:hypothetical protein
MVALAALAERMKTLFGSSKAPSEHKHGHNWDWGAVSCSALCPDDPLTARAWLTDEGLRPQARGSPPVLGTDRPIFLLT